MKGTRGITYKINEPISTTQFIHLLEQSNLGVRRPLDDTTVIEGMLAHSNLLITAWHGDTIVGVARSVTDFHYRCYLSDIAVADKAQHRGIGKELIRLTIKQLGSKCQLVLLSSPTAIDYYPKLGFIKHEDAWILSNAELLT
ncbi:GNAT family N-acetyltransferase [Aliivibrio kagoshimensis]|uniref:GNAT family N-acetyltransferase n=1 Tax=Aliivibrio kagoshimensis TaxID=2910230 RepID=UPI003D0FC1DD